MTAFYMFRLMSMTFFGAYRGPSWESAHAHAQGGGHDRAAHAPAHVAHGSAHDSHGGGHGAGHGHGPWHGPHESPRAMTAPLMALAVGAVVAGFFGVPAALGGGNAIEHFLEPSFTASSAHGGEAHGAATASGAARPADHAEPAAGHGEDAGHGEAHPSLATELGLMFFSVLVAAAGIGLAWRFYVARPEISDRLASRFAGAHRLLSNKYYVDELYDATVIGGTMSSGRSLWTFDRRVVDGAVNGSSWLTVFSAWVSGLVDRYVVDGLVNLVGRTTEESSYWFRRLQTGLVQNYALLMLFGIFVFVSVYLFVR
jgi:NADH-quinone oxidoreductase subunit L